MTVRRRPTHLDARGHAHMVDVGSKPVTSRVARAHGRVRMQPATLDAIRRGTVPKGDVLAVARIAGIQAAKYTSHLLPLCHLLPLDAVELAARVDLAAGAVSIEAKVACHGATGVEMEAIVAVSVAAAAIYDMCKALDRGMIIEGIELLEKSGGRSGHYRKPRRA